MLGLPGESIVIQLVASDDALAPALIEGLRALTPARPLRVAFDAQGLYDAPEGARVVLVGPERSARALNLHRPVVRTRRLQLLLWCTPQGAFELKGAAPDMNSWVSHRLHLPAAWPPRVAEALDAAQRQGEALSLLGPASPPLGFTPLVASLDPAPLAAALDEGPVWLTGAQDALDVFTALAVWAERGRHGLVLHDPAVVAGVLPCLDAAPTPWDEAAEACGPLGDDTTDPGALAARLGLDPAALGLTLSPRPRVDNPDFNNLLRRARAGERPWEEAEALGLPQLAAWWRALGAAPPRELAQTGRWVVLGPPRVAAPSQGGEAARRALPDGVLGVGLRVALAALNAEGPVDGLIVFGPLAEPPGAAGQRVAGRLIEGARRALGLGVGEVEIVSTESIEDYPAGVGWLGTWDVPGLSQQALGGRTTLALYTESPPGECAEASHLHRASLTPEGWRFGAPTRLFTVSRTAEVETTLSDARELASRGETDKALALLRGEALSAARRSGFATAVVEVRLEIAKLQLRRGEADEAERTLRRALRNAERAGDPMLRAGVLGHIAALLDLRGHHAVAAAVREEELTLHAAVDDVRAVAVVMGQLAYGLSQQGALEEAERRLRDEVVPELRRLGDERELAVALARLAEVQAKRGATHEAMRTLREEVIPIFRRLGERNDEANAWVQLAELHQRRGEHAVWRDILTAEVIPALNALNDELGLNRLLLQLAMDAARRGDARRALTTLREEVLPTFQRLRLPPDVAVTLNHIAELHHLLGELGEALRVHQDEALPLWRALGDLRSVANTQMAIAGLLMRLGALDEALTLLRQEVLPTLTRLGDVRERAAALSFLTDVLLRRGELAEARRTIEEEMLPAFAALEDEAGATRVLAQRAKLHALSGEHDQAERLLAEEVIPRFERLGHAVERNAMSGQRVYALTRLGRIEEAVTLLRDEVLPQAEALHDPLTLNHGRLILATALRRRAAPGDHGEAIRLLRAMLPEARSLKMSVEEHQARALLDALTKRRPLGVHPRWAPVARARHPHLQRGTRRLTRRAEAP